jgi:hypothetical protein
MPTNDQSRPVATPSDNEFTLTIDDAIALYEAAGISRTPRSVQRYCAKEDLSAHRIDTEFGQKYLITRASVERHIAYIKEVTPATSRDLTRPVATTVAAENKDDIVRQAPATTPDLSRLVATNIAPENKSETERQEGTTSSDQSRQAPTTVAAENKDDIVQQAPATTPDLSRPVAADISIFEHPYVKRLEAEVEEFKGKYEKQVRRTEDVLEASNKRLVDMAQAGQIASSKTLAEYLLASQNPPPLPIDHLDVNDHPDKR